MTQVAAGIAGFVAGSAIALFCLPFAAEPSGLLVKGRVVSHDPAARIIVASPNSPLPGVSEIRVPYDDSTVWEESHMRGSELLEGASWHASDPARLSSDLIVNIFFAGSDGARVERVQINREIDRL